MATLKCEACGAPLNIVLEPSILICEYCGIENTVPGNVSHKTNSILEALNNGKSNALMLSISSCGATIFQKKVFNIYQNYAQLIDAKTGRIEVNIFFNEVEKCRRCFGANEILFKMSGKRKIVIKCLWDGKTKEALNVLNGLIKPSK